MPDITTTQIFSDGEKGITATKLNNIIANSVIQPDFVTAKPSSSTLDPTDQLLEVKGAGTYARITGSQLISSVSAQVDATPQIYSVRLRSFNVAGNPTFEVDQRNVGNMSLNPAAGNFVLDRYRVGRTASAMAINVQQVNSASDLVVPGTNFRLSAKYLWCQLTTQQASLAAGDHWDYVQTIEGARLRELVNDVFSLSILASCSVPLKFGVTIRDVNPSTTKSLSKLCAITTVNTWTLFQFPNIPVLASGGNWNITPGIEGAEIRICLASGSSQVAPANDTWQNGSFVGAQGQDNFAAQATSTVFRLGFIQLEPGALSTTPIDCPFQQNYDDCLRYFQKSYDLETSPGTITTVGVLPLYQQTTTNLNGPVRFHKPMAKIPTMIAYNHATGAMNSIRMSGVDYTVSGFANLGKAGCQGVNTSTMPAVGAGNTGFLNYTADTGW